MRNKQFYITILVFIGITLFSCNNKERVYDSTGNAKKKRFDFTIGKFNKLVKSSDMDAKYAAAI
jgi:hypothetical protein